MQSKKHCVSLWKHPGTSSNFLVHLFLNDLFTSFFLQTEILTHTLKKCETKITHSRISFHVRSCIVFFGIQTGENQMYFPPFWVLFPSCLEWISFKIFQTSKQAWCLFSFFLHFHTLLYKSLQPMTPRMQLHPLPSPELLFFLKELIKSFSQSAGTFHAQRMFISSGILRMHLEAGLKHQQHE